MQKFTMKRAMLYEPVDILNTEYLDIRTVSTTEEVALAWHATGRF